MPSNGNISVDPNPEFDLFAQDFNHLSKILGC